MSTRDSGPRSLTPPGSPAPVSRGRNGGIGRAVNPLTELRSRPPKDDRTNPVVSVTLGVDRTGMVRTETPVRVDPDSPPPYKGLLIDKRDQADETVPGRQRTTR